MANAKKLSGMKFGRLTAIEDVGKDGCGFRLWRCVCECGNEAVVPSAQLIRSHTMSCGCLQRDRNRESKTTHGKSSSSTYATWCCMIGRCTNERNADHKHYGGRGISVCERWKRFSNFLDDMGEKPEGMSIERIDNNAGYSPENCRWATQAEQTRNKRTTRNYTMNGITKCIAVWSREYGVPEMTLTRRLNKGATIEDALGLASTGIDS